MDSILVHPPQQTRAADLLQRLVDAADVLLATRPYHEIRVADIAKSAGVSVGIVYTRFATKEHVLLHAAERLTAQLDDGLLEALSKGGRDASPRAIAVRYFSFAAEAFVRHRNILRPVTLLVRSPEYLDFRPLVAQFNRRAHGVLQDALASAAARAGRPVSLPLIQLAIETASALLRERVLYRDQCDTPRQARAEARTCARVCVAVLEGPRR